MTATPALTSDLKAQVKPLADDLRKRLEDDPARLADWKRTHHEAVAKDRTAMSWIEWRDDRIDQTAVAWALTTVFIRFCEDNSLIKPVWISGPPGRRQEALDRYNAYFRANPLHSDREWLEFAIAYLRSLPATRALVDAHSALEYVSPSGDGVARLREFWLRRGDDGALVHDLHDESLSTRFLGDLYQDLSDYAKERYALLQTPVFVEEHILDRTLEPALNDRQLEGFRMIDPTCGSGHFLLGAFDRLLDRWHKRAPGMEIQARVQTALDAIHGVDLNPFALAIARFRLTVAALKACELRSLEEAPAFKFHLAVGDSLIHGPDKDVIPGLEDRSAFMPFHYSTEDGPILLEILAEGRYDAVVGNPPYITPKDRALNKIYRSKFGKVCKGTYALTVPFMVEFFALSKPGEQSGWVGLITSKSFTKREFGVPLIEDFLVSRDLSLVEDTSGAYIPGHGTPTVILVGRNQPPVGDKVRAVLRVRGEPGMPADPAKGNVWKAIVGHVDEVGWDDRWVTVTDLDRKLLATHPWSLRGGGAIELMKAISATAQRTIAEIMSGKIGFASFPGADDAFVAPRHAFMTSHVPETVIRPLITGDVVRDWLVRKGDWVLTPYDEDANLLPLDMRGWGRRQWSYRSILEATKGFEGETKAQAGKPWWGWYRWVAQRYRTLLTITFAEVSTHNQFALDRGGNAFKQTAPVLKLPPDATERDYISLLGVLNSSLACFWIKQLCQEKPSNGVGRGLESEAWTVWYQLNGTTLQKFPLSSSFPVRYAEILDQLGRQIVQFEPSEVCRNRFPSHDALAEARFAYERIQSRMIAIQEELDWEVYRQYGLVDEDLTYGAEELPGLVLGERAFEIALARAVAADQEQTTWFERHGSTAITDLPTSWPTTYKDLVQRRLRLIADNPYFKLLEDPEFKRRWLSDSWEIRQERAVREWLLDLLEERSFWHSLQGQPLPRSLAALADDVTRNSDMVSVLTIWEGRPDVPVTDSLKRLLTDEVVPFHSGYRYKDSGIRKRTVWEDVWRKQRLADNGEAVGYIEVPPRYTAADFQDSSYSRLRGEFDVPKERFILYPDGSRDGDGTPLLGWAGWNHAEQALALASIIHDREQEGWSDERLVPLVAGLAELQPWVEQWHGDVDEKYGVSLAAFCAEELARRAAQVSMTIEQLRWWRPEKRKGKGRGKA